jgi:hypothetical protein
MKEGVNLIAIVIELPRFTTVQAFEFKVITEIESPKFIQKVSDSFTAENEHVVVYANRRMSSQFARTFATLDLAPSRLFCDHET